MRESRSCSRKGVTWGDDSRFKESNKTNNTCLLAGHGSMGTYYEEYTGEDFDGEAFMQGREEA